MQEIWKDIPGYEGMYQASNLGRVKGLDRTVSLNRKSRNGLRKVKERVLKGRINQRGYLRVVLAGKEFRIHQLVAMAFLDHKPDRMKLVVDHINGNKLDNRVDNLRVVTQRENCVSNGKTSKYRGVHFCKIKNKFIAKIYVNGKSVYLGSYRNDLDASFAYEKALKDLKEWE